MAYTGVYVFGDSLVDAGNALKLAEWYSDLTFSDLPDGAPTAELGYFAGRFSDGYTYADLISNKAIGAVTKPVFPFGYEDPWIGIPIAPFAGDPNGNNLNFAYGGAQVRQGDEVVQDLDSQTDTFRNAVDGDAPPGALYIITMGGNDVRSLAGNNEAPADLANGYVALDRVVDQLIHEIGQLIDDGARNFLITGCADVGFIPDYDVNNNGRLDPAEQARADAATIFSQYLDLMIRTEVVPALKAEGATVTYVPMMDYQQGGVTVAGGLSKVLPTIEALHGLAPGTLTTDLLTYRDLVFFDDIHPNAQVHALFGSYAQALLTKTPWIETLPLSAADVDYSLTASIAAVGEVDNLVFALAAGTNYRFDMLGVSSLGTAGSLADPSLRLLTSGGTVTGANADSGAGFDAMLTFTSAGAGNYTLEMSATGTVTGAYQLHASVLGGAAMTAGQTYVVGNAATIVLEGAGGAGVDVVQASASYTLKAGSEIELLTTTNARGKGAINLTGNEFGQQLTGNAGANILDGKGGADVLTGGAGKDVFVLGGGGIDRITDYAKGEIVDISQALSVAAGTNVTSGGYVRVTTGGLVQIDANGGGDQWTTLGSVNGNGAVTVRYLSGGTLASAQVSRVAETTLMAASVAAAGMATLTGPEPVGVAEASHRSAAAPVSAPASGEDPGHFALAEAIRLPMIHEDFERAAGETVRHAALAERAAFQPGEAAPDHAGPLPLLEATDFVAAPMAPATAEVAMPAAAMLGAILADALGPEAIAVPLDAVPGGEAGLADIAALAPVMQLAGLEMLALHADAVATV